MTVLLKNLTARTPHREDLGAVSRLIGACENAGTEMAHAPLAYLLSRWQEADFRLATNAWVIVTTRGQIVGFACVWHEDHLLISTFVCVHPAYRHRGIGTVLLRLVEMHARQQIRHASPASRLMLRGLVGTANEGAQRLFVREGYQPGPPSLHVAYHLSGESTRLPLPGAQRQLNVPLKREHDQSLASDLSTDHDGLCAIYLYSTYEKELRPASAAYIEAEASADVSLAG